MHKKITKKIGIESIEHRLIFLYVILVLLVIIVSSTFILIKFRMDESDKNYKILDTYVTKVGEQITTETTDDDIRVLFDESLMIGDVQSNSFSLSVLNTNLKPVAYTELLSDYTVPSVIAASNGNETFDAWRSSVDSNGYVRQWFELARPIYDENGDVRYVIYARTDATTSVNYMTNISNTLFIALCIAFVLSIFIGTVFAKMITDPIIKLSMGVSELKGGDLDQSLKVYSNDEIGQLTDNFNGMAQELKSSFETINSEKNKLEVVLNNMTDGVIAYDKNEELIHANSKVYDILGNISYATMEELFDALRITELNLQRAEIETQDKTVVYDNKSLNIKMTAYGNNSNFSGILIVIQDITKIKRIDEMRKDFVANVSHEIRTPLTTIKAYAETLKSGIIEDDNTTTEFLSTIESEADRMTVLADDLLELSKLDNKKLDLKLENNDLVKIINDVIKQNEVLVKNKKQKIEFNVLDEKFVYCDKDRVNQVFNNILTNAIKYGKNNGCIKIDIKEMKTYYDIIFVDDGIGIPKEDLDRIFERFYRVDKARSREMGGTGLGLAITRQIIESHNGMIYATSDVGKGTTMYIRLLKYSGKNYTKKL